MWRLVTESERPGYKFPYYKKLEKAELFYPIDSVEEPYEPEGLVHQVFKFGVTLIKYVGEDESKDYWQTPKETNDRRAGDCEDMAIWLCRKSFVLGVTDIKFVVGKMKIGVLWGAKWLGHAWAEYDGYVYDIANYKVRKESKKLYDKTFKPFYGFDRSNRYRWDHINA